MGWESLQQTEPSGKDDQAMRNFLVGRRVYTNR
jgi:hypothetical protein